MGPFIVTADEISDPHKLQIRLWVNGELKQNFNTSDMAHKIPRCIEWITSIHTLEPGDVLATGTNHRGLNAFQDGDRVELETEGLGRLRINVRDELKRTWGRETRLDRRNDRVAIMQSEVRHEDGRLLATAIGSFAIFPRERLGGHERRAPSPDAD